MRISHRDAGSEDLARAVLEGDSAAAARLITRIENGQDSVAGALALLHSHTRGAYRVGITGPPGSGKSTLVDGLVGEARARGRAVGVVAVDPTSPFSGGALLGDRVQMGQSGRDPGVFIRSMATRGSLGGLARATSQAADVLAALGKDLIFIETVGVGQSELDVFNAVDSVVVVLVPESGGGIQAMKAGLMEIAHCFVVNKADRPDAWLLVQEIEEVLTLSGPLRAVTVRAEECPGDGGEGWPGQGEAEGSWKVPVLTTVATRGVGVAAVLDTVEAHGRGLREAGLWELHRRRQARARLKELVLAALERRAWGGREQERLFQELVVKIAQGELDPVNAAAKFLA